LGTFQSTNRQALEAIKKLQEDGKIKGVGTNRNYLEALKHIAKHTTGNLRDLTKVVHLLVLRLKVRELEVLTHKITEWLKRYARFDVLLLLTGTM
jgi:DNA-binding Lrp family transcriptional regulator